MSVLVPPRSTGTAATSLQRYQSLSCVASCDDCNILLQPCQLSCGPTVVAKAPLVQLMMEAPVSDLGQPVTRCTDRPGEPHVPLPPTDAATSLRPAVSSPHARAVSERAEAVKGATRGERSSRPLRAEHVRRSSLRRGADPQGSRRQLPRHACHLADLYHSRPRDNHQVARQRDTSTVGSLPSDIARARLPHICGLPVISRSPRSGSHRVSEIRPGSAVTPIRAPVHVLALTQR